MVVKHSVSRNKKILGYILYSIFLIVGLLYYRFPSDAFSGYLQAAADRINPRFLLSVGEVHPSLPFGLRFDQTEVSLKEKPDTGVFTAQRLLISPELWSFLQGEFKYSFDCLAYDGDLKGCVHFSKISTRSPFTTSIELKDIRIDDHAYLSALIGRNIRGILGGTITYSGQYNLLIEGTGEADLRISDGRVELSKSIFGFESVDFNELLVKMLLKKRKIELTNVELTGPEVKGTLSGTIRLRKDFLKSRLSIRGTIEPFASFLKSSEDSVDIMKFLKGHLKKGKLSFMIYGTLLVPRIKFI